MSDEHVKVGTFNPKGYSTYWKVSQLPLALRQALSELPMADAGQPFNAGCVINSMKPLPFARLIFAAVSKEDCIIHYEHGGIAHFFILARFRFGLHPVNQSGQAKLLWRTRIDHKIADLKQLNILIKDQKLQLEDQKLQHLPDLEA